MAKAPKPKPEKRPQDIATKAEPFIKRMEYLDAEMQTKREEIAEGKKIIVEEAEAAGIAPKAFKRVLKLRKLEATKAALTDKLDMDEAAQFSALADAFGGTPFGEFAQQAANELHRAASELLADGTEVSVHFGSGRRPSSDPIDDFGR